MPTDQNNLGVKSLKPNLVVVWENLELVALENWIKKIDYIAGLFVKPNNKAQPCWKSQHLWKEYSCLDPVPDQILCKILDPINFKVDHCVLKQ